MQPAVNDTVNGFLVKSRQEMDELEGVLWELEHEKTGAKLVWLERQEENKTFGIAFQTQPWDDTGVFHILEHSVLCGSEKYPVKEPFVELMKSSLNTFLNAMTFPDKTFYPVSSRNDQDFVNLLRVYMDAVFHPRIHQKPEIFCQEGWHYELDGDGVPSYKGVVFNEMKGALASPDSLLEKEMNRGLFPDTCYRWVSGGDPEHIPELTYEQFTAAHRRLYHPSNSYIFLDGNMEIDSILSILDGEYLADYDRAPAPGSIPYQQPVDGGVIYADYELSPQEELAGRTILADGFGACTFRDREKLAALRALADVLCGGNQAPLKRRLLESGLARDVRLSVHDGIQQPWVCLEMRDIREEQMDEVSGAIRGELERLAREGLDHQRILATLDNMEFQARQRDYGRTPQGLVLGISVLESWLYGGEPGANLSVGTLYDGLRQKCEAGYFEELVEQVLLNSAHRCRVVLRPSHTAGRERQEREAARLQSARESWSREELVALRELQAGLEAWQRTPDSPEELASIPVLRLDQIPGEPEELPLALGTAYGIPVLRHELPTSGISYVNLYFALDDLSEKRLSQASLLCDLLGSLDTAGHPQEELQKELRSRFGGLQFSVEAYDRFGCEGQGRVFLCVSCSVLDGKVAGAVELLTELLQTTNFHDAGKISALLCQFRTGLTQQITMNGHSYAISRMSAGYSVSSVVQEHTDGITYLEWLKGLEDGFQEKAAQLAEELEALAGEIFIRSRLTLSVTASSGGTEASVARILSERLPEGTFTKPAVPAAKPWGKRREGFVIPADISFAVVGGPFPAAAGGAAVLMGKTASLAYLWNAVRVQGGAYGTGMVVRNTGLAAFYSYRDPSAARTLGCYRQVPAFLEGLGNADLTGFIIGAVAESDPLLTPRMKGKTSDADYWRGIVQEDRRRIRRELLSASAGDVAALAGAVRRIAEDGAVCVIGSRRQLEACGPEIDEIYTL